jgi:hypothetical protein
MPLVLPKDHEKVGDSTSRGVRSVAYVILRYMDFTNINVITPTLLVYRITGTDVITGPSWCEIATRPVEIVAGMAGNRPSFGCRGECPHPLGTRRRRRDIRNGRIVRFRRGSTLSAADTSASTGLDTTGRPTETNLHTVNQSRSEIAHISTGAPSFNTASQRSEFRQTNKPSTSSVSLLSILSLLSIAYLS